MMDRDGDAVCVTTLVLQRVQGPFSGRREPSPEAFARAFPGTILRRAGLVQQSSPDT
jgi:hypothetical protein